MRDKLKEYVNLLFAGASGAEDVREEILQNTLDRYDDLISQGKAPEAAYSLAIMGIGDVQEILGTTPPPEQANPSAEEKNSPLWKRILKVAGIFLYILSPVPLFVLSEMGMETIGLCGTLSIVALATGLMVIIGGKSGKAEPSKQDSRSDSRRLLRPLMLALYFIISFATNAWWITWLIFPIFACIAGLLHACRDYKEATSHEN